MGNVGKSQQHDELHALIMMQLGGVGGKHIKIITVVGADFLPQDFIRTDLADLNVHVEFFLKRLDQVAIDVAVPCQHGKSCHGLT